MQGKWLGILIGIMLCCGMSLSAADFTLSAGGQTSYSIAVAQSPIPAEVTAANDLAKYLKAVTGAEFKMVKESDVTAGNQAIYVGQTTYAAAARVDFNKLGQEEWVIKTTADGNLILSGGRPRGTLYAVYEFLETQVGCHWLDETNEIVPEISQLKIPSLNVQGQPYFRNRQIFDLLDWYPVSQSFKVKNKGTCYVAANYGWSFKIGRPNQHHTFYYYSKSWAKEKSELYSLNREGKRLIASDGNGPGQICLTNPEARRRVLSQLKAFIAEDRKEAAIAGNPPAPTVYDISQNDNDDYCVCETCKTLAEKEGSNSGPLLDFINYIANNIKKDYPDIYVRTFAYTYSRKSPKNIKPADNVLMHIALLGVEFGYNKGPHDTTQTLAHPYNKQSLDIIESWSRIATHLAIWDYAVIYLSGGPAPETYVNISRLQPDMAFYKAKKVKDTFVESEYPHCTSFFGLKRYLIYKLMQNPDRPAQPVIDEFMNGYYGKATPVMRELLAYMEKRQNETTGPIGKVDISQRHYLDLDYFTTTLDLLDQAEKQVAGNAKLTANVRREWIPILSGLLQRWHYLDGAGKLFNGPKLLQQFREESLAAIDYYFPAPDSQTFRKESLDNLEKTITRFENNLVSVELPAQFKNRQVVDLPWACFRVDLGRSKLIEDPEAIGGKTIALGKDVLDRSKNGSTSFEIYNWNENKVMCAMEIKTSDVAKDEKYHLLKMGRVNFVKDSMASFYGASNREIRCELYRIFPTGSCYDAYVSVKFQGPDYVPGSTRESSIMVERVIFVDTGGWKQKEFIITMWLQPPATDENYAVLVRDGYNLTNVSVGGQGVLFPTSEAVKLLDIAQKNGIKSLIGNERNCAPFIDSLDDPVKKAQLDELIDTAKKHPAFEGYYLCDEPSAITFPKWARLAKYLKARDPEHLVYINLFPSYASKEQLGVLLKERPKGPVGFPDNFAGIGTNKETIIAYNEHLKQYLEQIKPELISYDNYNFLKDSDGEQYFLNLELIRSAARNAGVPFLNIVQASCCTEPGFSWRLPSKPELRWLAYTTMAYGGRGISWYLYWGPAIFGGLYQDGKRMPEADFVAEINQEIKALGPELMKLDSTQVYQSDPLPAGTQSLAGCPIKTAGGQYVIGMFKGEDGQTDAFMLMNRDYKNASTATVTLNLGEGQLMEFSIAKREWFALKSIVSGSVVQVDLIPGGGKLFKVVKPST